MNTYLGWMGNLGRPISVWNTIFIKNISEKHSIFVQAGEGEKILSVCHILALSIVGSAECNLKGAKNSIKVNLWIQCLSPR